MATKAERFRYDVERAQPARPGNPKRRPARDKGDPSSTARRTLSRASHAVFALEDRAAPGRPSRKSTRKSKNRQKAGTQLKAKQLLQTIAPGSRHDRGPARARGGD